MKKADMMNTDSHIGALSLFLTLEFTSVQRSSLYMTSSVFLLNEPTTEQHTLNVVPHIPDTGPWRECTASYQ